MINNLIKIGIAVLVVFLIIWYFKPKENKTDIEVIQSRIDSLMKKNDSLDKLILFQKSEGEKLKSRIDSFEGLKPKIITKYVNKYKEIDSASAGTIVNHFDSIFSTLNSK